MQICHPTLSGINWPVFFSTDTNFLMRRLNAIGSSLATFVQSSKKTSPGMGAKTILIIWKGFLQNNHRIHQNTVPVQAKFASMPFEDPRQRSISNKLITDYCIYLYSSFIRGPERRKDEKQLPARPHIDTFISIGKHQNHSNFAWP